MIIPSFYATNKGYLGEHAFFEYLRSPISWQANQLPEFWVPTSSRDGGGCSLSQLAGGLGVATRDLMQRRDESSCSARWIRRSCSLIYLTWFGIWSREHPSSSKCLRCFCDCQESKEPGPKSKHHTNPMGPETNNVLPNMCTIQIWTEHDSF